MRFVADDSDNFNATHEDVIQNQVEYTMPKDDGNETSVEEDENNHFGNTLSHLLDDTKD